jgi:uncharacterized membrane protein YjfL (UPF0719 family)
MLLIALPMVLLMALAVTLLKGAAREVREDGQYVVLFVALGASWLIGLAWALGWLGIHVRDDALERNNVAAAVAASGALSGGMIVYGGANLGEGATIWMTIGPALLGTVSILSLWGAHQMLSGATDAIVLDRDLASGIRFAGMTLGTGLVVGRALVGDYVSAFETVRDLLVQSWPALPLVGLSVLIQVKLRPTPSRPKPNAVTRGLLPALAYLGLGGVALVWLGAPPNGAQP